MGMSDILLGNNPAMMKEYPIPGRVAILFGASCYREYRVTFVLCETASSLLCFSAKLFHAFVYYRSPQCVLSRLVVLNPLL